MYSRKSSSEVFPMGTISKRIILKTISQLRGIFVYFCKIKPSEAQVASFLRL